MSFICLPINKQSSPCTPFTSILQSFTTVLGTGLLVSLFVSRFKYHDPILQDPFKMVLHVVLALCVMGTGYITTLGDGDEV